ncbi:MAG: hypothetical protein ACLFUO_02265 [Candidatus Woesearchaeota archaeon]
MEYVFLEAMLVIANLAIIVFTLIYCLVFMISTVKHEHRKSWDLLFIAIVIFLIFQTLKMLRLFGIYGSMVITLFFELAFSCVFLYVFVFQRDLISRYPYIKITKKKLAKTKKTKKINR